MLNTNTKFFIFDTHPIQYRSPLFQLLAKKLPQFKVFFYDDAFDGNKWWFNEVGTIPKQKWEGDLKGGFNHEVLGSGKMNLIQFYRKVRKQLTLDKPEACLVYGYYLPENWCLWWLCKRLNIPLLFIGETITLGKNNWRKVIKRLFLPFFFSGIKQIISLGLGTESFYRSLHVPNSKITQGKYSIQTDFFEMKKSDSDATRKKIRKELKIPENAFVILFAGRLFERKRPFDALSIHTLLSDLPEVHTVIVGNGLLEDELKQKAASMKKVHLVGFKNQEEIRSYYHASDILLVTSEFEFWPTVVSESFACRMPAIVTETCAVAGDLVLEGQTGYIFKIGDTQKAASLIRNVILKPEKLRTLQENAFQKVNAQYDITHFVESIHTAVEKAVAFSYN